jgi:uncharacterized protein YdaU (DUF1376 family)
MLLGASWEIGPLPKDRRRLASIIGAQLDEFDEAWKVVGTKFDDTDQGLVNRRLEHHRAKQAERSEKARKSAKVRWPSKPESEPDPDAGANAYADADADVSDSHPKIDANGMLEGMRSACSLDLRPQILESENPEPKRRRANARTAGPVPPFHQQIIEAYNRLCPQLPRIKTWPKHRRATLDERIRERCADGKPADTVRYWEEFFESVAASDFLCGRTRDQFAGTSIDWLLGPKNFPKVIEGNYQNRQATNGAQAHG